MAPHIGLWYETMKAGVENEEKSADITRGVDREGRTRKLCKTSIAITYDSLWGLHFSVVFLYLGYLSL